MTADGFLAIIGPSEAAIAPLRAAANRLPDLRERFTSLGVVVLAGASCPTRPLGAQGLLVGDVFAREPRVSVDAAADGAVASGGRLLVERCWGDYLAVLADGPESIILRSPSGGMPAYVARQGAVHCISSDVQLLLVLGVAQAAIDWTFVADHLAFPHLRGTRTGLADIRELFPGEVGIVGGSGIERRSYWTPWRFADPAKRFDDPPNAAAAVHDAVKTATAALARRYPSILLELSGGLDSSIVAAALVGSKAAVTAVNFVTPTGEGDERRYARAMAERTGYPLVELPAITEVDLTRPLSGRTARPGLPGMLRNWDEQLIDAAVTTGASAFFGGTGGDNVFCSLGSAAPAADALRAFGLGRRAATAVRDVARVHGSALWQTGRLALRQARRSPPSPLWPRNADFLADGAPPAEAPYHPWLVEPPGALPGTRSHIRSIMAALAHLDGYGRQAVAPSVFPLLAQPVIETCLRVPSWLWVNGGRDRAIARQAFADDLPTLIVRRQTKGMMNAFSGLAYERNRARLLPLLLDGHLAGAGLLDRQRLAAYLQQVGPVRDMHFYRVLALADVELWLRSWLDT